MATQVAGTAATARRYQPWERWFAFGLLATLTVGTPNEWIRTYYGVEGTKSALVFFTPLLLVALVLGLQRSPQFFRAMRMEPLIPMLLAWAVFSAAWSLERGTTFRQAIAWLLATTFAYYLVTRFELREILELLCYSYLLGTVLNVLWIFAVPRYGRVIDPFDAAKSGWKGIASNKNSLGQFCAGGAVLLWMGRRTLKRHRMWFTIGAIVNVAVLLRTDSKTSLVTLIGTAALMVVFRIFRAQRQLFPVVIIAVVAAVATVVVIVLQHRNTLASGLGRSGDLTGRTELWADLWPQVMKHPIQGFGWGGFWNGWLSPAGEIWRTNGWLPPDAHNLFLQLAIDLGFVGVALYFISMFRGMARSVVMIRDSADPIAMLPIVFLTYEFLGSITEHGNLGRDTGWVLHVVVLVAAGHHVRTARAARASRVATSARARQPGASARRASPSPPATAASSSAIPPATPR